MDGVLEILSLLGGFLYGSFRIIGRKSLSDEIPHWWWVCIFIASTQRFIWFWLLHAGVKPGPTHRGFFVVVIVFFYYWLMNLKCRIMYISSKCCCVGLHPHLEFSNLAEGIILFSKEGNFWVIGWQVCYNLLTYFVYFESIRTDMSLLHVCMSIHHICVFP